MLNCQPKFRVLVGIFITFGHYICFLVCSPILNSNFLAIEQKWYGKKVFFDPPYWRHQKVADSFYSGKIEVYKSKSTSDIIEISTMDWLEQLVVIRWTIIWIGSPYLSGRGGTNAQTFLLWKAWKLASSSLCVRLFTLFHFFFPAFKSEIGLEVTPLVTFVSEWWWFYFNSLYFTFHLPANKIGLEYFGKHFYKILKCGK